MRGERLSILVVSGTYPPDLGGSEVSLETACRELARRGHHITVLADDRRPARHESLGALVLGVAPEHVESAMCALHRERRFDVLLTQLVYSREALRFAASARLPSVYFVRNVEMRVELSSGAPHSPARMIASSRFVARRALERWGRRCDVVYPLIDRAEITPASRAGDCVSLVNPISPKGGHLLRDLARRSPDRRFLGIVGWTGLRTRDGDWDPRQWALMAAAHDDPGVHPPEEPHFDDLPNVTLLPPARDMRPFYARTRVLLFPARWEEAFGRAILEALLGGIPVLATDVGGIRETGLRRGGALLDPAAGPEVFERALRTLDDRDAYEQASAAALQDAAWYDLDEQVDTLERVVLAAARREEPVS